MKLLEAAGSSVEQPHGDTLSDLSQRLKSPSVQCIGGLQLFCVDLEVTTIPECIHEVMILAKKRQAEVLMSKQKQFDVSRINFDAPRIQVASHLSHISLDLQRLT